MRINYLAANIVALSFVLVASCVQSPEPPSETASASAAPTIEATATTPCEDACFVLYLAACAVCAQQRLGRPCYEAAMNEYVRCARRCREEGR